MFNICLRHWHGVLYVYTPFSLNLDIVHCFIIFRFQATIKFHRLSSFYIPCQRICINKIVWHKNWAKCAYILFYFKYFIMLNYLSFISFGFYVDFVSVIIIPSITEKNNNKTRWNQQWSFTLTIKTKIPYDVNLMSWEGKRLATIWLKT